MNKKEGSQKCMTLYKICSITRWIEKDISRITLFLYNSAQKYKRREAGDDAFQNKQPLKVVVTLVQPVVLRLHDVVKSRRCNTTLLSFHLTEKCEWGNIKEFSRDHTLLQWLNVSLHILPAIIR